MGIVIYGLGPIGLKILEKALQSKRTHILGAVDIDPEKIGKDLGTLLGEQQIGIKVVGSIKEINTDGYDKKIALHATGSNLEKVWPQLKELVSMDYSVVSSCEELSYPWFKYKKLSGEIDEFVRTKNQFLIGSGVNPGFVMDSLVLNLSAVTDEITGIKATRMVDVSQRRLPLQEKVGVGLKPEEFIKRVKNNMIGHIGLEESLRLIAYGMGLVVQGDVFNNIEPTIVEEDIDLSRCTIKKGEVSGQAQISKGITENGIELELNLHMSLGIEQKDEITIENKDGTLTKLVIPNGIFGDTATANIIVNTALTVANEERHGLLTITDIKFPRNSRF